MVRNFPHPFAGQGTLCSAFVSGLQWMIDSGCSHDVPPGWMLGSPAFVGYRKFYRAHCQDQNAHAGGLGEMILSGGSGPMVLP
jgi:hypothetical protein